MPLPEPAHLRRRREKNPNKIEPVVIMKDFILKFLFSKMGQPIAAGISVIAGFIVHYTVVYMAQYLHYAVPVETQSYIAEGVSAFCYAAINFILHKYAGDRAEMIQRSVGVNDDRWIGNETLQAIDKHVEFAKKAEVIPEGLSTTLKMEWGDKGTRVDGFVREPGGDWRNPTEIELATRPKE